MQVKELIKLLGIDISEAESAGFLPANLAILKMLIALHERMDRLEEVLPKKEGSGTWQGIDRLLSNSQKRESEHTDIMIAFMLDSDTAKQLVIPGGEASEDLHITLCYLGNVDEFDGDMGELKEVVARYALTHDPINGHIGGIARFAPSDSSENLSPIVALINNPGLQEWRRWLVNALDLHNISVASDFDFLPHCTLGYIDPTAPMPVSTIEALPLVFDTLWLCIGDERISYKLGASHEIELMTTQSTELESVHPAIPISYLRRQALLTQIATHAIKSAKPPGDIDIALLKNDMVQFYLEAQRYSYNKAMATVGIKVTQEGIIGGIARGFKATFDDALAWAKEQVSSIVSTLQEALSNFVSKLGDIEIDVQVAQFLSDYASWKAPQIANVTWSSGADAGTGQAIEDILNADSDELPGIILDNIRVRVLPEESSSDRCKEYAGHSYGLEEYSSLGINFPFHPNCPHYAEIYMDTGDEML